MKIKYIYTLKINIEEKSSSSRKELSCSYNMSSSNSSSKNSKKQKRAAFDERMQRLRSAAHSSAMDTESILHDASKYIGELKEKIEELNEEVEIPEQHVTVESLDNGFLVNVLSEKKCPGLLFHLLEAFEELGLDVLDARASCSENFHFEAVSQKGEADGVDPKMLKQVVIQVIKNWNDINEQE